MAGKTETLFRPACEGDAASLTDLAVASKRHWGYPQSWIELWLDDLRFTPELIRRQSVEIAETQGVLAGVSSLSVNGSVAELEHLWVEPQRMGRGLGRSLFERAVKRASTLGATSLAIAADPHAEEFYLHMGAVPDGFIESVPEGRRLPRLVLVIRATIPRMPIGN